jgi:hypothetical protein
MASAIVCDNGHRDCSGCRKAAREISQSGALKPCHRCGSKRRYIVTHKYPYDRVTVEYEVLKVSALRSPLQAEEEGWDPMVFLMKNRKSSEKTIWPYYWTKDRNGKWANGQFPPLLSIEELKKVIKDFEQDCG